jgi:hypothetical protein
MIENLILGRSNSLIGITYIIYISEFIIIVTNVNKRGKPPGSPLFSLQLKFLAWKLSINNKDSQKKLPLFADKEFTQKSLPQAGK